MQITRCELLAYFAVMDLSFHSAFPIIDVKTISGHETVVI